MPSFQLKQQSHLFVIWAEMHLKYFPMKGLAHEEEYRAVAKACAEEGFALEPTGGIDIRKL